MSEPVKKIEQAPESYSPKTRPEILSVAERASEIQPRTYHNIIYRAVDKPGFRLAGKRGFMEEDIWGQCKAEEGFFRRLAEIDIETPSKSIGYCIGGGSEGKSPWLVGVETGRGDSDLEGLDTLIIPPTLYLVFESHGPMNPNFHTMQAVAYDEYFNDPEREYDWHEGMRSFEKYCTEDAFAEDTVIELWCPVVKR